MPNCYHFNKGLNEIKLIVEQFWSPMEEKNWLSNLGVLKIKASQGYDFNRPFDNDKGNENVLSRMIHLHIIHQTPAIHDHDFEKMHEVYYRLF